MRSKIRQALWCTSAFHLCVHWALSSWWPMFSYGFDPTRKKPQCSAIFTLELELIVEFIVEQAEDQDVQHRGLGQDLQGGELFKVQN